MTSKVIDKDQAHPRQERILDFLKGRKEKAAEQSEEALLKAIDTTLGQLRQVAYGKRPLKLEMAINLHKFSKGELSMFELRPDIDWDFVKKELSKKK